MATPTTEFTAHQTDIPGLLMFDITSMEDERGYFQEKYQQAKLVAAGMPENFQLVQTNISYNKTKGVARGLHAEPWYKYISVANGKVFGAYVDLRKGPNFGRVVTIEIDKNKAVFVPIGVANSFETLTNDTYYIYSVSDHWSAEKYNQYISLNMADPALGIKWPLDINEAVVSDRDRNHPRLEDLQPLEI